MLRPVCRGGLLVGSLALAVPLCVRAQVQVSVQPRLSSVVPIANVYEVTRNLGSDSDPWDVQVSATTLARSPAVSLAIQVGDAGAGWLLRSGLTRSIGSVASVHGILDPRGPGVPELGERPPDQTFEFELPSSMTIGYAEAVLPLLAGTSTVRPYVSVGAALKSYRFGSFDPAACESVGGSCGVMDFTQPRSGTVLGAQVGAGVILTVWSRSIEIGAVDTFNDYAGRTKHDLNVFVGISLPLYGGG